eukprot:gene1255-1834_t
MDIFGAFRRNGRGTPENKCTTPESGRKAPPSEEQLPHQYKDWVPLSAVENLTATFQAAVQAKGEQLRISNERIEDLELHVTDLQGQLNEYALNKQTQTTIGEESETEISSEDEEVEISAQSDGKEEEMTRALQGPADVLVELEQTCCELEEKNVLLTQELDMCFQLLVESTETVQSKENFYEAREQLYEQTSRALAGLDQERAQLLQINEHLRGQLAESQLVGQTIQAEMARMNREHQAELKMLQSSLTPQGTPVVDQALEGELGTPSSETSSAQRADAVEGLSAALRCAINRLVPETVGSTPEAMVDGVNVELMDIAQTSALRACTPLKM